MAAWAATSRAPVAALIRRWRHDRHPRPLQARPGCDHEPVDERPRPRRIHVANAEAFAMPGAGSTDPLPFIDQRHRTPWGVGLPCNGVPHRLRRTRVAHRGQRVDDDRGCCIRSPAFRYPADRLIELRSSLEHPDRWPTRVAPGLACRPIPFLGRRGQLRRVVAPPGVRHNYPLAAIFSSVMGVSIPDSSANVRRATMSRLRNDP